MAPNKFNELSAYHNAHFGEYNFYLPENASAEEQARFEEERGRFTYNFCLELRKSDEKWGLLKKGASQNHYTDKYGNMTGVDVLFYSQDDVIDILLGASGAPPVWVVQGPGLMVNWFIPLPDGTSNGGEPVPVPPEPIPPGPPNDDLVVAVNSINSTLQMIHNVIRDGFVGLINAINQAGKAQPKK